MASIGFSQFKRLEKINKKKIYLYNQYLKYLKINEINLQNFSINQKSIPWTFPLTLKNSFKKKKIILFLKKNKIETRRGFFSPSRLKLYKVKKNLFPISDYLSTNVLCLPLFLDLNTQNIKYICSKINLFFKN